MSPAPRCFTGTPRRRWRSRAAAIKAGDLAIIGSRNDLLAVQYYNPAYVAGKGARVTKHPTSQASWQEIYPDGLFDLLIRIKNDYGDIPLTITENGMPSANARQDQDRIAFLRDHLAAAHRAIQAGVKLESYHLWSLLDNFEWAEGYSQRWGIVHVDYTTHQRTHKASARLVSHGDRPQRHLRRGYWPSQPGRTRPAS